MGEGHLVRGRLRLGVPRIRSCVRLVSHTKFSRRRRCGKALDRADANAVVNSRRNNITAGPSRRGRGEAEKFFRGPVTFGGFAIAEKIYICYNMFDSETNRLNWAYVSRLYSVSIFFIKSD